MTSRYFGFILPLGFFGMAFFAWVQLGNVAASDVGAAVGNNLRQLFGGPRSPTHPVLGLALLSIAVLCFIAGLFCAWRLFKSFRHEHSA